MLRSQVPVDLGDIHHRKILSMYPIPAGFAFVTADQSLLIFKKGKTTEIKLDKPCTALLAFSDNILLCESPREVNIIDIAKGQIVGKLETLPNAFLLFGVQKCSVGKMRYLICNDTTGIHVYGCDISNTAVKFESKGGMPASGRVIRNELDSDKFCTLQYVPSAFSASCHLQLNTYELKDEVVGRKQGQSLFTSHDYTKAFAIEKGYVIYIAEDQSLFLVTRDDQDNWTTVKKTGFTANQTLNDLSALSSVSNSIIGYQANTIFVWDFDADNKMSMKRFPLASPIDSLVVDEYQCRLLVLTREKVLNKENDWTTVNHLRVINRFEPLVDLSKIKQEIEEVLPQLIPGSGPRALVRQYAPELSWLDSKVNSDASRNEFKLPQLTFLSEKINKQDDLNQVVQVLLSVLENEVLLGFMRNSKQKVFSSIQSLIPSALNPQAENKGIEFLDKFLLPLLKENGFNNPNILINICEKLMEAGEYSKLCNELGISVDDMPGAEHLPLLRSEYKFNCILVLLRKEQQAAKKYKKEVRLADKLIGMLYCLIPADKQNDPKYFEMIHNLEELHKSPEKRK